MQLNDSMIMDSRIRSIFLGTFLISLSVGSVLCGSIHEVAESCNVDDIVEINRAELCILNVES